MDACMDRYDISFARAVLYEAIMVKLFEGAGLRAYITEPSESSD